ncbi:MULTISPECIES: hypothetical protein [unclassified Microbacterium]|uniref:hypothetical protein n=1 Tax=unclassified Microbacterium TaxID=2609290 RepID=UPI00300FAB25
MRKELRHVGRRAQLDAAGLSTLLDKMRDDHEIDEIRLRAKFGELAAEIDSEWASIVLLAFWNSLRAPGDAVRPHVKRALELLQRKPGTGRSRALTDLAELVSSCWLRHEADAQDLAALWTSTEPDRAVTIQISGARLPTAGDARALVSDLSRSIMAIAEIVSHRTDPGDVLPAARFPHLSRLPATGEAEPIWLALYLRLSLIIRLAPWDPELAPISEQFSTQIYSETGQSRVLGYPEARTLLINSDEEVAAYPVIDSAGACWTSSYLLADSLAPWLLSAIQRTDLRERVISQPFEDKVVEHLRAHGFTAGPVDRSGTWTTQTGREHLPLGAQLPGQIDVLAIRGDALFVLECKSIFSMGKIRNIAEKLGPDSHEWRTRLRRKRDWCERSLGRDVDLAMIVIEGIDTYMSERELEVETPLVTFDLLSEMLESIPEQRSSPRP